MGYEPRCDRCNRPVAVGQCVCSDCIERFHAIYEAESPDSPRNSPNDRP